MPKLAAYSNEPSALCRREGAGEDRRAEGKDAAKALQTQRVQKAKVKLATSRKVLRGRYS